MAGTHVKLSYHFRKNGGEGVALSWLTMRVKIHSGAVLTMLLVEHLGQQIDPIGLQDIERNQRTNSFQQ